jgi:Domain of unknown function (DUF4148)
MNSKLLYAATLAVSLLGSTVAFADDAPATRAQVKAELNQAIANGTLRRTDYELLQPPVLSGSATTREQVARELAQERAERAVLVGADASRDYNPLGTHILDRSMLARSTVKNEVLQAAAQGTLQRSDYDDAASIARKARAHAADVSFAQRVKGRIAHDAG